ncbi:hypothetical protein BB560_003564 [Smittium megazygosporum]|uniref:Uncharacterized protein n=1 Tax=Smittium megazygosporum TaxID=133381 RepID=A0A2T9ZBN5_9FUNG|nr:hypothetical protein BB560_003564 [Smittium megazygosporum]
MSTKTSFDITLVKETFSNLFSETTFYSKNHLISALVHSLLYPHFVPTEFHGTSLPQISSTSPEKLSFSSNPEYQPSSSEYSLYKSRLSSGKSSADYFTFKLTFSFTDQHLILNAIIFPVSFILS